MQPEQGTKHMPQLSRSHRVQEEKVNSLLPFQDKQHILVRPLPCSIRESIQRATKLESTPRKQLPRGKGRSKTVQRLIKEVPSIDHMVGAFEVREGERIIQKFVRKNGKLSPPQTTKKHHLRQGDMQESRIARHSSTQKGHRCTPPISVSSFYCFSSLVYAP